MTAPNPTESPTQSEDKSAEAKPSEAKPSEAKSFETLTAAAPFSATETVELESNYLLPVAIVAIAAPIGLFLNLWVGLVVGAFGLFLAVQASRIRLIFTSTALDVYTGEKPIRSFPYAEWENWEIFWSPVPILFYFKEVNSIHFIPILYNPTALRQCLAVHQLPTQHPED